jgi:hypothetical protein
VPCALRVIRGKLDERHVEDGHAATIAAAHSWMRYARVAGSNVQKG